MASRFVTWPTRHVSIWYVAETTGEATAALGLRPLGSVVITTLIRHYITHCRQVRFFAIFSRRFIFHFTIHSARANELSVDRVVEHRRHAFSFSLVHFTVEHTRAHNRAQYILYRSWNNIGSHSSACPFSFTLHHARDKRNVFKTVEIECHVYSYILGCWILQCLSFWVCKRCKADFGVFMLNVIAFIRRLVFSSTDSLHCNYSVSVYRDCGIRIFFSIQNQHRFPNSNTKSSLKSSHL